MSPSVRTLAGPFRGMTPQVGPSILVLMTSLCSPGGSTQTTLSLLLMNATWVSATRSRELITPAVWSNLPSRPPSTMILLRLLSWLSSQSAFNCVSVLSKSVSSCESTLIILLPYCTPPPPLSSAWRYRKKEKGRTPTTLPKKSLTSALSESRSPQMKSGQNLVRRNEREVVVRGHGG